MARRGEGMVRRGEMRGGDGEERRRMKEGNRVVN